MFNNSKYTYIYYKIINKAKLQNRNKKQNYFEKHHIIPTSIGGENNKDNTVLLTFKEHYICHRLLCKMLIDKEHINKMKYALYCLSKVNMHQSRSLSYHQKQKCLESNREASKTRNHKPFYGKKHTEKSKRLLSIAATGKTHSPETKAKLAIMNIETRESRSKKVSESLKGVKKSPEHCKAISEAAKIAWQKRKNGRE